MSDPIRHLFAPHIYLDDRKLSTTAALHGLTPVADFTIKWGASDWYTNIEPSELTLTLIDPIGEFLSISGGQGTSIKITRDDPNLGPDSVTLFRGTVDSTESRYGYRTDPRTGKRVEVWHVTLVATDPLGRLAQDRSHGPKYPDRELAQKRLHWGPGTMRERKEALAARSPVPIRFEATNLDQYDDETTFYYYPVASYETQQNVSVLTVLRNTARISEVTNRPFYDPHADEIRFLAPPNRQPMRNTIDGDLEMRSAFEFGFAELIDGSKFTLDDGIAARTTATEQVTRLELIRRYEARNATDDPSRMESVEVSTEMTAVADAPNHTTWSIETDLSEAFNYWHNWTVKPWNLMRGIYGRQSLDPIEFLPALDPSYTTAHEAKFMRTAPHLIDFDRTPLIYGFRNSLMNWPQGTGPFVFVGGEMSYTAKGWRVFLNPAPVPLLADPGFLQPTLGQITRTHRIDAVKPDLLVADYQKLTTAT